MQKIYTPNHPCKKHLADVVDDMKKFGPPSIRCLSLEDGSLLAIEGSHRLNAAKILDIDPIIVIVDPDEYLTDGGTNGDVPLGRADTALLFLEHDDHGEIEFSKIVKRYKHK